MTLKFKTSEDLDPGYVYAQLQILRRICDRGLHHFSSKRDSNGTDLFQHMSDEIERTMRHLNESRI